jgi:hypothetical protein
VAVETDNSYQVNYEWEKLNAEQFEIVIEHLLRAMGFKNVARKGGPGDEGEDVSAQEVMGNATSAPLNRAWSVQCKRHSKVKKSDIMEEISWFDAKETDVWLLCTSYSPSPSFKRWFDGMKKKRRSHFKIAAWWRNELDIHVTSHIPYLLQNLDRSICQSLGFSAVVQGIEIDAVKAATSVARSIVDGQIRRFARSKYLPNLYVKRELQARLSQFHSTEENICQHFKSKLSREVNGLHSSFEAAIRTAEHLKLPYSFHGMFDRLTPKERDSKLKALNDDWNEFHRRLWESSVRWIKQVRRSTELLQKSVAQFSATRFIDHPTEVQALNQQLEAFRELIGAPPVRILPDSISTLRKEILKNMGRYQTNDAPPQETFSIISLPTAICDPDKHLNSAQETVEILMKNALLVIDRAGSGKTNLLCHVASELSQQAPVVLLFGKQIDSDPDELVNQLCRTLSQAFNCLPSFAIVEANRVLGVTGDFVHVFVDGINEARNVRVADTAVVRLLEALHGLRFRITLTCRDIYWEFFDYAEWSHFVQTTCRDALDIFSHAEYAYALPLYLKHFRIKCDLRDEALEQCQHPLLLRFFCEAYGDIDGNGSSLGLVDSIRLKELFDEYIRRKAEQIRAKLCHQNAERVTSYLRSLVEFMFANVSTSILTSQVGSATGDEDVHTRESMYVALLDEDIILEERPTSAPDIRHVSFVYEAFMEYMMARALIHGPERYNVISEEDLLLVLNDAGRKWINAKGVADFIALMLFSGEGERHKWAPAHFLYCLASGVKVWKEAFWSIVGKLRTEHLVPEIFDLFPLAMSGDTKISVLKEMLKVLGRSSSEEAQRLCAVLIWSAVLPLKMISWSMLHRIETMNRKELASLADTLCNSPPQGRQSPDADTLTSGSVLNATLPYLEEDTRLIMEKKMSRLGRPAANVEARRLSIQIIWDAFPKFQPMVLNALFTADRSLQRFAAFRISGAVWSQNVMILVYEIAKHHRDRELAQILIRNKAAF